MTTLAATPFDEIYRAFVEAFSDYVVPFAPDREQLLEMQTRRGWRPDLSAGAFEGGRLVGFALNALDGDEAYNSGTGVVPSSRRGGLAARVMRESIELLRAAGARRYVLEVIESNVAARALYTSLGFVESRRLQSWTFESDRAASAVGTTRIDETMWDIEPSWQNSTASLRRARAEHVILGDERGYAVVFPGNGDLPQLAVAREHRRRGLGRHLLESAAALAGKPLRIMNVDTRDHGIAQFLDACGARPTIVQLEMTLTLSSAR